MHRIAYRCALIGLIPVVGGVFGPIAVVLGVLSKPSLPDDASQRAISEMRAAILLGVVAAVTNWLGVLLMWIGWHAK